MIRTEQLENAQIAAAAQGAQIAADREYLARLRAARKRQRDPFYRSNIDFQIAALEQRLGEQA